MCEDVEDMGRVLNEFFVSVFTREREYVDMVIQEEQCEILGKIIIMREEVLEELKSLKVGKSPGPDGLFPRIAVSSKML